MCEQQIRQIYSEVAAHYQCIAPSFDNTAGFAILASPVISRPKCLIIGHNPGGTARTEEQEEFSTERNYITCSTYVYYLRLTALFHRANGLDILAKSQATDVFFFRTPKPLRTDGNRRHKNFSGKSLVGPKDRDPTTANLKLSQLRNSTIEKNREWLKKLIEHMAPQKILICGKGAETELQNAHMDILRSIPGATITHPSKSFTSHRELQSDVEAISALFN